MFWSIYIYYIIFNILLWLLVVWLYRLFIFHTLGRVPFVILFNQYTLSLISSITLIIFTSLSLTLNYYQDLVLLHSTSPLGRLYINSYYVTNLFNVNALNLNLTYVYTYPFIYIFILITILAIFICLSYNTDELLSFTSYCILILMAGYVIFYTDSFILFFFAYELLLVPSFFILYKFAKTRRCVEAAYLMFFYTQFGALFLIFVLLYILLIAQTSLFSVVSLIYFTPSEVNFLFLCSFIGFGVKLPVWPFYGWLPKAHVEASTNFSIFLSGVLVKFAFFALLKFLIVIQLEPSCIYIYPFLLIGIVDAVFKLFYQIDLKKLVAYSTVVEMHWLAICTISGYSNLLIANFCMLISHALLSSNSFILVDAIARRFKTRLITEISGINFLCPKLFLASLLNLLIFLGFPGSLFFISEVLFFSFCFDLFPLLTLFLMVLLYLLGPSFFFRSWMNVLFGKSKAYNSTIVVDLSTRELLILVGIPFLMYWLGSSWQAFIL